MKPNSNPMNRAMAGLTKGRRQATIPMKKSGLLILLFIIICFFLSATVIGQLCNEPAKVQKMC